MEKAYDARKKEWRERHFDADPGLLTKGSTSHLDRKYSLYKQMLDVFVG